MHQVHISRILLQMCLHTAQLSHMLGPCCELYGHLFLTSDENPADRSVGFDGVPVVAEQSSIPP